MLRGLASAFVALWLPTLVLCDVYSLAGLNWTLKNQNESIAIPATVPSQAHLDLFNAGIITEPLSGINGPYHVNIMPPEGLKLFDRIHTKVDSKRKLDVYCRSQ